MTCDAAALHTSFGVAAMLRAVLALLTYPCRRNPGLAEAQARASHASSDLYIKRLNWLLHSLAPSALSNAGITSLACCSKKKKKPLACSSSISSGAQKMVSAVARLFVLVLGCCFCSFATLSPRADAATTASTVVVVSASATPIPTVCANSGEARGWLWLSSDHQFTSSHLSS